MKPLVWRKSSRSDSGDQAQCVELASGLAMVGIRDSKNPDEGHLTLSRSSVRSFLDEVKSGKHDLL